MGRGPGRETNGGEVGEEMGRHRGRKLRALRKKVGDNQWARVKAGAPESWEKEEGLTQEVRVRGKTHGQAEVLMGTHVQSWGFLGDKRGHGMGVEDAWVQRRHLGGIRVSHKGLRRTCLREHWEGAREGPRSLGRCGGLGRAPRPRLRCPVTHLGLLSTSTSFYFRKQAPGHSHRSPPISEGLASPAALRPRPRAESVARAGGGAAPPPSFLTAQWTRLPAPGRSGCGL